MNAIDLFAGCGGLSKGFMDAGFDIIVGVDNDQDALNTFALNHNGAKPLNADLSKQETFDEIKKIAGDKTIDVIIAGPPCQGFSLTGPRNFDDERNKLYLAVIEMVKQYKPSEEHAIPLIRKLKEFGVLKAVKASDIQKNMADLLEEDIEMVDVEVGENEYFYVFTFVGVIVVAGRVLKCYPKYLLNAKEPTDELRKVIKVLEKYNAKEQIVRMFNDSSESNSFNLLAVLLFLLQDYFENDVYTNTEDIIECNGSGEILWDKTINETFTFLSENRPYYIELQTRKRVTNDFDYFKRLHECLVTMASKELQDAALLDLFEMTGVDLTDEELDDFGDKEYILYRIENELNTQFNTRKQLVLKTMYAYIDRSGSLYDTECLSLFGTNSFNLVWEKICAEIMDNQLDVPLGILKLPVPLKEDYNRRQKLIELIEKPLWTITGKCAKDTLIPDLVSICKVNDQHQFIIFDAKYYNAHLERELFRQDSPA